MASSTTRANPPPAPIANRENPRSPRLTPNPRPEISPQIQRPSLLAHLTRAQSTLLPPSSHPLDRVRIGRGLHQLHGPLHPTRLPDTVEQNEHSSRRRSRSVRHCWRHSRRHSRAQIQHGNRGMCAINHDQLQFGRHGTLCAPLHRLYRSG